MVIILERMVYSEKKQENGRQNKSVATGVAEIGLLNPSLDDYERVASHINDGRSLKNDPLIGHKVCGRVYGIVKGGGHVITARVGETAIFMRGTVFPDFS